MNKEWKMSGIDCPNCGDNLKVFSQCSEANDTKFETWVMDDDEVVCNECGFRSTIILSDTGEVGVQDGNINELQESE